MKTRTPVFLLLALSSLSAVRVEALCPTVMDCQAAPLAVPNEYAADITGARANLVSLAGLFETERIVVRGIDAVGDESEPVSFLLFAEDSNAILGRGKTLDEKKAALQKLINTRPAFVGSTVDTLEPNHYVFGEAACVPYSPADDARKLIGLPLVVLPKPNPNPVVVAVLDSGTQVDHPSFKDHLWVNNLEVFGDYTRDGDGNGVKGDYYGAAFEGGADAGEVMAKSSHGMMAAGIVNARASNGPAGIAPYARVMTLQFLDKNNIGKTWDAARAIRYATYEGAKVINMSWTTRCTDTRLQDAVTFASTHGVLLVAAAGNRSSAYDDDNDLCKLYPASYAVPTMLAVSATNSEGCELGNSRYGRRTIHLSAPGAGVWSTDKNDKCAQFDGTSAAAPVVAGTVALLEGFTPSWDWKRRRQYLLDSAQPPPNSACTLISMTGRIVNAARATTAPVRITKPSSGDVVNAANDVKLDWDILFASQSCAKLDVYYTPNGQTYVLVKSNVPTPPSWTNVRLPAGATTTAKIRVACSGTLLYAESETFRVQ